MTYRRSLNRGSALLVSLIIVAVILVGLGVVFKGNKTKLQWGNLLGHRGTLQERAQSGFNLIKADLLARKAAKDFTSPPRVCNPTDDPACGCVADVCTTSESEGVGFLWDEARCDRTDEDVTECEPQHPRIVQVASESGMFGAGRTIRLEVFVFPSKGNPFEDSDALNALYPKAFKVISEARNEWTGDTYTVEGEVALAPESMAEFTFGIMGPFDPPRSFDFFPGDFTGRVHFGRGVVPNFVRGDSGESQPNHVFHDLVTFDLGDSASEVVPGTDFTQTIGADVSFERGFKKSEEDDDDVPTPTELMGKAEESCPTTGMPFPDNGSDLCLKFVDDAGQGKIEQWPCNTDPMATFMDFYTGEHDGGAPLATYTIPQVGAVICHEGNVKVKGLLNGRVTVVSRENSVVLAGDIRNKDQSPTSTDAFAAIAWRDIVIPHQVPGGGISGLPYASCAADNDCLGHPLDEFLEMADVQVDGDRYELSGADITVNSLEIDGFLLAVDGKLDVQNLNDFAHDPTHGYSIPAEDPLNPGQVKYYQVSDPTGPDYYYEPDPNAGPTQGYPLAKAEPLYCYGMMNAFSGGVCDDRITSDGNSAVVAAETARSAFSFRLYGGIVAKDMSNLRASTQTITIPVTTWEPVRFNNIWTGMSQGRRIQSNSMFSVFPPSGVPDFLSNVKVMTLSQRGFPGRSPRHPHHEG